MSHPLLSIIIPTKNRQHTLLEVVGILLSFPDRDFEIIVQDCSDSDEGFREIKNRFNDQRLKCFKSPSNISMTENWNYAVLNCFGEYLIFIGDDDLVGADVMKVVRWAKKNNLDAVCGGTFAATYCWPDFPDTRFAKSFEIHEYNGGIEYPNSLLEAIKGSFGTGVENYPRLPKIYHGIIKRNLIENLYKTTGKYFDGIAPDYYAAFSLAFHVKKYCIIDYSLFIVGVSRNSNTGRVAANDSSITKHWLEYDLSDWPQFLPLVRINQMLVAESMIKAFANNGRIDLVNNLNISKLYSLCIFYDTKKILKIFNNLRFAAKTLKRSCLLIILKIIADLTIKCFLGVLRRMTKYIWKDDFSRESRRIFGITSMKDALIKHQQFYPNIDKILESID